MANAKKGATSMRNQGFNADGEIISSAYVDHDPEEFGFHTEGPSLTRQEFAAECDINNIMAQYEKTGVVSHVNNTTPQYLDVSETPDNLAEAMAAVEAAKTSFMTLPANVRKEFDNDPVKFVEYAQYGGKEADERLRGWGLLEPLPVEPPPQKVEVVNHPQASPPEAP